MGKLQVWILALPGKYELGLNQSPRKGLQSVSKKPAVVQLFMLCVAGHIHVSELHSDKRQSKKARDISP